MLVFEGFSNLCLTNAEGPLGAANTLSRRALYGWTFLSLNAAPVHSSSGLPVQEQPLSAQRSGDYLFVMPSYGHRVLAAPTTARALRAASKRFHCVAGLDTGAYVMAHAGFLNGRQATCHWDILNEAAEAFAEVAFTDARFVIDGNRASCGGATTTLELMLELIERRHGTVLALEVAALFMYGERAPNRGPDQLVPTHKLIAAAAAIMRRNVENPSPSEALVARLHLSRRALELAFQDHAGTSPGALYQSIRLAEARRRLQQTRDSIAEVTLRAGYQDATVMAGAFKAEFGVTPSAVRAHRKAAGR